MNRAIAHSHHPGLGLPWAFICSVAGHAGFVATVLFFGVLVAPFQKNTETVVLTLPHGVSLDVTPGEAGKKPKGEDRVYDVANAVPPPTAPRPPAPTPAPTPDVTPAPAAPTPAPTPAPSDDKKIVIPDKTSTATPEPKKADVKKVVKATPPPETPKPAPPVKSATKTPAASQKEIKPGASAAVTASASAPGKVPDIPSTLPPGPGGPAGAIAKGDPNGATQWGDPNAPINTSVILPADYLAELVNSLRANFQIPNNLQGVCVVQFKIARDGTLGDIKVVTSTGYPALDEFAMRAVRTTAHVRAYAEYTQVPEITATVPFRFGAAAAPATAVN